MGRLGIVADRPGPPCLLRVLPDRHRNQAFSSGYGQKWTNQRHGTMTPPDDTYEWPMPRHKWFFHIELLRVIDRQNDSTTSQKTAIQCHRVRLGMDAIDDPRKIPLRVVGISEKTIRENLASLDGFCWHETFRKEAEARRTGMSSRRYDPSQRQRPMGRWNRSVEEQTAAIAGEERESNGGARSFLSVVVPSKDEAASLPQLVHEIAGSLRLLCRNDRGPRRPAGFEMIIVDDASSDETRSVLDDLALVYPELIVVSLAVGVGQSAATVAGIRAAGGDWIATLDADLQNDPADLVRLWEALPGHDVALGWRVERQDTWSKRVLSRWANRVRNAVLGQSIRDTGCSVRIFPRAVALRLPMFHGVHRFLGPLLLREGCRLVQVPVRHRPRPHGWSHYNLWNRSLQVGVDLVGVAWLMRRPLRYQVLSRGHSRTAVNLTGAGRSQRCQA
jgi:dolichol-phosphate mannosyltransferase